MGYTHYWRIAENLDEDKFGEAVTACYDICHVIPVTLRDMFGLNYPPRFNPVHGVWFNGQGDESHESFVIGREKKSFDFCKTNRKPYDLAVVCCLIVLANAFPETFIINSNGGDEDWEPARVICEDHLGYGRGVKFGEVLL